jgi:hypothetical protein
LKHNASIFISLEKSEKSRLYCAGQARWLTQVKDELSIADLYPASSGTAGEVAREDTPTFNL